MNGPFVAHETVTFCSGCNSTFNSQGLQGLVPSRCNMAYDLLVFVGRALFQRYRTVQEVRIELVDSNIRISASEINYLGRKFITYLAIAHQQATPRIRDSMSINGGYILHLDALHDSDAPALMTGIDSLSKTVLANVKLPSEKADHIIPFLMQMKTDYGDPLACVRDMSAGIGKAIGTVFPDVFDFICHFHFLRDIGKDYMEPAYARLRKCLRSHCVSSKLHALAREMKKLLNEQSVKNTTIAEAVLNNDHGENKELTVLGSTYSLTIWVLEGKRCGNGYGFPFDRPLLDFAERILELEQLMPDLLNLLLNDDESPEKQFIFKLVEQACYVAEDPDLRQAVSELSWRRRIFDRLRSAMRIAPQGGDKGLNDDGTPDAMSTIRQEVVRFRKYLKDSKELTVDMLSKKMIEQIDKYSDKLFADPITVDTPSGPKIIYPQRTNNILEQFFRGLRRGYRRKTGNNSMHGALQAMLADTPLVKNLDNPDYMEILLDGKESLEKLFAEQGAINMKRNEKSDTDTDRILSGFRALIDMPSLPKKMIKILQAV